MLQFGLRKKSSFKWKGILPSCHVFYVSSCSLYLLLLELWNNQVEQSLGREHTRLPPGGWANGVIKIASSLWGAKMKVVRKADHSQNSWFSSSHLAIPPENFLHLPTPKERSIWNSTLAYRFSKVSVDMNPLGIMLQWRFWYVSSELGPETLHF